MVGASTLLYQEPSLIKCGKESLSLLAFLLSCLNITNFLFMELGHLWPLLVIDRARLICWRNKHILFPYCVLLRCVEKSKEKTKKGKTQSPDDKAKKVRLTPEEREAMKQKLRDMRLQEKQRRIEEKVKERDIVRQKKQEEKAAKKEEVRRAAEEDKEKRKKVGSVKVEHK